MARTSGLKTELILNLTLLLSAALLFSGFLLLKLTEGELLRERSARAIDLLESVSRQVTSESVDGDLQKLLPESLDIDALVLVNGDLRPSSGMSAIQKSELRKVRATREPSVRLFFDPYWLFRDSPDDRLLISVPLVRDYRFTGALQGVFSLDDIRQRLRESRRVMFWYALLYGGILFLFGLFLLIRNVIRPVTKLTERTRAVAGGNLEGNLEPEGPGEIAELGRSFNEMVRALMESRQETSRQIAALETAYRDLQRTRDDLVRSAKLASVGHLAAGMAHEIGNPLGASLGYLELLKGKLKPDQRELADRTIMELERIDRLVKDLLDYAAPGRDVLEKLDPAEVAREARHLLTLQGVLEGVRLKDDLPEKLSQVAMARHKLLQIFVNLLLNARDAVAGDGMIRLSGDEVGTDIRIAVEDDGPGIPPEILPHLFDPFFTTKEPGKGRGLGLSVCHRIVEEAGGRLEVHSEPGSGSTFSLYLKRAEL